MQELGAVRGFSDCLVVRIEPGEEGAELSLALGGQDVGRGEVMGIIYTAVLYTRLSNSLSKDSVSPQSLALFSSCQIQIEAQSSKHQKP